MKPLMVLAGGFGTRLRSLITDVPKPLAPVAGRPFLIHLIEKWVAQGAKDFIFLLHFEAHLIKAILHDIQKDKTFGDLKIDVITENQPLGTGGSVLNAIKILNIKESFLVVNADTWLSGGLSELNNSLPNSIGAVSVSDCSRYGELDINDGVIKYFMEKNSSRRPGMINAGLYHLNPDAFSGFSKDCNFSIEREVFPNVIKTGELKAVELDIDFIDIGIPEDYLEFCSWIEKEKKDEKK